MGLFFKRWCMCVWLGGRARYLKERRFKKSVFLGEIRMFRKGVVYIVVRFVRMVEKDRSVICLLCSSPFRKHDESRSFFPFGFSATEQYVLLASLLERIAPPFDPLAKYLLARVHGLVSHCHVRSRGLTDTLRRPVEARRPTTVSLGYARRFWHFFLKSELPGLGPIVNGGDSCEN